VGDKVEARVKGWSKYYPGQITAVNVPTAKADDANTNSPAPANTGSILSAAAASASSAAAPQVTVTTYAVTFEDGDKQTVLLSGLRPKDRMKEGTTPDRDPLLASFRAVEMAVKRRGSSLAVAERLRIAMVMKCVCVPELTRAVATAHGMCDIVTTLQRQTKKEEDTFWLLHHLLHHRELAGFYTDGLPLVEAYAKVLEFYAADIVPDVTASLGKLNITFK
jgi:hypothetical protein